MSVVLMFWLIAVDTTSMTLSEALATALRISPASADARLDSAEGEYKYWSGWSTALPTLNGSASLGWSSARGVFDTTRKTSRSIGISFGAGQVLFDASAIGAIAQGYYGQRLAFVQSGAKVNQLVWNVRTSYYALQKAYALLEVARQGVSRAAENLRLAQAKAKLGQSTAIELLRAQTGLHQARLEEMSAEKGLLVANENLKTLLGVADELIIRPEPVETIAPKTAFTSLDAYWREVVRRNPGLEVARQNARIAELGQKIAYGRMLPSLSFSVAERFSDSLLPRDWKHWTDRDIFSFGFSLGLPILNIKEIVLGIRNANIAVERARLAQQTSINQLRQSVLSVWLNYEQSVRQIDYAVENLRLNQELQRQAQEQYRLGQLTQLELFAVETGLTAARVAYLNALTDARIQEAQLDYLLGRW